MGSAGKQRNEVGARCANGGWWAGFRNSGCRSGETLSFIFFVFSIFTTVILQTCVEGDLVK